MRRFHATSSSRDPPRISKSIFCPDLDCAARFRHALSYKIASCRSSGLYGHPAQKATVSHFRLLQFYVRKVYSISGERGRMFANVEEDADRTRRLALHGRVKTPGSDSAMTMANRNLWRRQFEMIPSRGTVAPIDQCASVTGTVFLQHGGATICQ